MILVFSRRRTSIIVTSSVVYEVRRRGGEGGRKEAGVRMNVGKEDRSNSRVAEDCAAQLGEAKKSETKKTRSETKKHTTYQHR